MQRLRILWVMIWFLCKRIKKNENDIHIKLLRHL